MANNDGSDLHTIGMAPMHKEEPVFDGAAILSEAGSNSVHVHAEKRTILQTLLDLSVNANEGDMYNAGGTVVDLGRPNSREIVTNNHAVPDGYSSLTVTTASGKQYHAVVEARDEDNDLAFLRVDNIQNSGDIGKGVQFDTTALKPNDAVTELPLRTNAEHPTPLNGTFLREEVRNAESSLPMLPNENPNRPLDLFSVNGKVGDSGAMIFKQKTGRVSAIADAFGSNLVGAIPAWIVQRDLDAIKKGDGTLQNGVRKLFFK